MKEEKLKEKFKEFIGYLSYKENGEITICNRLYEKYLNIEEKDLIKNKISNLIKILNDTKQKSNEDFKKLIDRDIETDIWYIV